MSDVYRPTPTLTQGWPRRLRWTCSDFMDHDHRWYVTAWLCGRWQEWRAR